MIDFASYTVYKVTLDELKAYYNPVVINKFCSECNKFNKIWSCPPLPFKDIDYISKFQYCYIISGKVYIDTIPSNLLSQMVSKALNKYSDISKGKDAFSDIFNGLYYTFRDFNDSKILELEKKYPSATSLVSGRCLICDTCTRMHNIPCIHPDKLRYSLEGLGFDVAGILENIVGEKIQWSNNSKPEYVTCVSALLSNDNLNPEDILNNMK